MSALERLSKCGRLPAGGLFPPIRPGFSELVKPGFAEVLDYSPLAELVRNFATKTGFDGRSEADRIGFNFGRGGAFAAFKGMGAFKGSADFGRGLFQRVTLLAHAGERAELIQAVERFRARLADFVLSRNCDSQARERRLGWGIFNQLGWSL